MDLSTDQVRAAGVIQQLEKNRSRQAGPPKAESTWAFFFDIDGTLLTIASTPAGVSVDCRLKQTLGKLHAATGGAIAFISGRQIAEVDRLFAPLRLPTAGQHGIERRDEAGVVQHYAAPSRELAAIKNRLEPLVARHLGLLLEEKGLTLAIHYRQAPRLGGYLHRLVRAMVNSAVDLRLQPGKMVLEIVPVGSDKGNTIMQFMSEPPFRGKIPVFLGDDVTDEHGFAAVNALGGHSIKVGPGRSAARWRLPDVQTVRLWLEECVNRLIAGENSSRDDGPLK